MKTTKKEMDKYLRDVQGLQRQCFKKGPLAVDVHAHWSLGSFSIDVLVHPNDNDESDDKYKSFRFYQFYEPTENDAVMQDLSNYINATTDAQRD